jgi:hypothetical protein
MKTVFSSIDATIEAYAAGNGEARNTQGNVFAEGDVLYDYGYHFPMAMRTPSGLYIINGDKYSVTTGKHQGWCIHMLKPNVQIPLSALQSMIEARSGIVSGTRLAKMLTSGEIKVIDNTTDRWDTYEYKNKDGEWVTGERHFLGDVLLEYDGVRYLSAFDHQEPMHLNPYFLTTLQGMPDTVDDAYKSLMPDKLQGNKDVLRQGEWYFLPTDIDTRELDKVGHMTSWIEDGTHIATEVRTKDGKHYVRGCVRHNPGKYRNSQHTMLKLGKAWHEVIKNTAGESWQASGLVD